jgi:hypothetical protein
MAGRYSGHGRQCPFRLESEMKRSKALLMAAVMAATSVAGTSAWADHDHYGGEHHGGDHYYGGEHYGSGHHHDGRAFGWGAGLVLGSALLWAATRPPTVVYREPVPVMVAPPPVYMAPPPPADGWWYFCRASGAYYPYAHSCPGAWERVAPH